jgi:hypothetical protein
VWGWVVPARFAATSGGRRGSCPGDRWRLGSSCAVVFDTWLSVGNRSTLESDYLQRHGHFTAAESVTRPEHRAAG